MCKNSHVRTVTKRVFYVQVFYGLHGIKNQTITSNSYIRWMQIESSVLKL